MASQYNFVRRTQKNINLITSLIDKQQIPVNNDKFYEVTNLLNCCLGLVAFVYQAAEDFAKSQQKAGVNTPVNELIKDYLQRVLHKHSYNSTYYGIVKECYPKWQPDNVSTTDMAAIVYRLRNAICHNDIKPIGGKKNKDGKSFIESIHFYSKNKEGKVRFNATMTIKQLERFSKDVSSAYLEYVKNDKKVS